MNEPIQITLPTFDNSTVNVWLFLEPEPVLIDCGEKTDKAWQALQDGLHQHGIKVSDIKKIIITHAHIDHMGLANRITQHSDAMIYVSEYVYDWAVDLKTCLDKRTETIRKVFVANDKNLTQPLLFDYKMLAPYWDEIPKERLVTFPMEGTLEFGGKEWEIIYAPGHCINQTCFYQKETKQFFSADALLKIFPIPIIDYQIQEQNQRTKSVPETIETFKKILEMDIDVIYPGHWETIYNPQEIIQNQINRVERKTEAVYQLIKNGTHDFATIYQHIYPKRVNPATRFMVVGFLDILLEQQRIEGKEEDGQLFYYTNG